MRSSPGTRGCARGSSRCRRWPGSARARSCRGGRGRCGARSRGGAVQRRARRAGRALEGTKVRCASSPSGRDARSASGAAARPATPSADSSGPTSASRSPASVDGHEELDRADRRPALAVAALGADPRRAARRARPAPRPRRSRPARCARPRTRSGRPAVAAQRGDVAQRSSGAYSRRRYAASAIARRRGSPSASQRPTRSKTLRGASARSSSTSSGGSAGLDLRRPQPGLEPRVRALRALLDAGPLEDHVGASTAASATASGTSPRMPAMRDERVREPASPASSTPLCASAVRGGSRRAPGGAHRRRVLRREQAQHRALERVAVLEVVTP